MNNIAYILKGRTGSIKVIFETGWPWIKKTASGRTLTDGCAGDRNGYITLDEADEVLMFHEGVHRPIQIELTHPVLAEVRIG